MKSYLYSFLILFTSICTPVFAKGDTQEGQSAPAQTTKKDAKEDKTDKEDTAGKTDSEDKGDKDKGDKDTLLSPVTLKIGNLAFPTSQQPGPLVSFGQNILDKKQLQISINANQIKGHRQYFIDVIPQIVYAFAADLTLTIDVPEAVRFRVDDKHSSGGGDVVVQLEYTAYSDSQRTFVDQATIVTNLTLPTGSTRKNPPTGLGANSFFIGGTYNHTEFDWIYFASTGYIFNTSSHRHRAGDSYLYQMGVCRRIFSNKDWLFDWMLELDGELTQKDIFLGKGSPDSGGNVIYVTPSFWLSTSESFFIQGGVGFPVVQQLQGHQIKNDYLLIVNSGWTF